MLLFFAHMENTSKPLPGAGAIISDSWKLFTSTWNTSVKTSGLMIYVGLAYMAGGILAYLNASLLPLTGVISLLGGLATAWIAIRVILTMLKLESGQQPMPTQEESKKAWAMFLPMIWVGFLTGLVTVGASLLLILPGIYFAVALYFGQIILIDQGTRGTQALAASRALVRGRWWATLWRLLAGGVVFGLLIGITVGIVVGIAGTIAGPGALKETEAQNGLVYAVTQMLQMIVLAALMPLVTGFQVKLYRLLQRTR